MSIAILMGREVVRVSDIRELADWRVAHPDAARIGLDTIELEGQQYDVSTVFLCMDHGFGCGGLPIWFETMIFRSEGESVWCERYSTWEAADAGHRNACAQLASGALELDA